MEDADAWWVLRLRALREHPGAFGSSYESHKDRPLDELRQAFAARSVGEESVTFGAFERGSGEMVGCVGCVREQGEKSRHKSFIWGMYVAAEVRGRGVGRALMEAAVARARAWSGVEQVHLNVAADNPPAIALYRTLGFISWGREPRALKLPERYVDEEHMVLIF